MRCPYCEANKDRVIDSRPAENGKAIRRRRECLNCSKRFTTYETVEETTKLVVVKRDRSRVPFDKAKMLAGLEAACYKRPVPTRRLQEAVDHVTEELRRTGQREIDAEDIGQRLAEQLRTIDQVAYVRFASVYKQFRDLDDLIEEVRGVLEMNERLSPGQGKLFR
ncbi:transcriptional regulator NrdR [Mucisphaera calidilacus]|uniref:Transcriptional repressor NrdR n=1 Tax=Mucisphaera calidilacus TaxID=2527982 RepID=A0A518BYF0_9BACT|nr:transcriptional regulator NrdR [Mucisphaera calidilacus]QDU71992.1 Transcriptional repressor NrdR [Mucisphaera calidilacus]